MVGESRRSAGNARGGPARAESVEEIGRLCATGYDTEVALYRYNPDPALMETGKRAAAGDLLAVAEVDRMVRAKEVQFLPIGTPVRTLKDPGPGTKIKVTDGPDIGTTGWVLRGHICGR